MLSFAEVDPGLIPDKIAKAIDGTAAVAEAWFKKNGYAGVKLIWASEWRGETEPLAFAYADLRWSNFPAVMVAEWSPEREAFLALLNRYRGWCQLVGNDLRFFVEAPDDEDE